MREIENQYDVLVLDCGAGISENVTSFALSADLTTVVATPEPTAMTDAYATIKALAMNREYAERSNADSNSIGVIVNQAESRREAKETYERLAAVAARFLGFPVTDYGHILRDEHVPAAVRQRSPLILQYPRCSASACLADAASRLAREMGQPQASPGLFYRVMNMFM
jgi:flagellar biosynthesis protein FlhG